jgi:hypothetical protein
MSRWWVVCCAAPAAAVVVVAACVGDEAASVATGPEAGGDGASSGGPACAPTDRTCVDTQMRGCNPDGTGFSTTPLDTCATPALCKAGLANGHCAAPACDPSQIVCDGGARLQCNADRTSFGALDTCDGGTPVCEQGACVECATASADCVGRSPRGCDAGHWQTLPICAATDGGGLDTATCVAGDCIDIRYARWTMPNDSTSAVHPIHYTIVSPTIVHDDVTLLEWQRGVSPAPVSTGGGGRQAYCESLALDGTGGWHLPSTVELLSLMDYAKSAAPMLDTTVFTGTPTAAAGSEIGLVSNEGIQVDYDTGLVAAASVAGASFTVRCVRASARLPTGPRFTVAATDVTDTYTKLVWQKGTTYRTSSNPALPCVAPYRLPTVKELYTLVDPTGSPRYFDSTTFTLGSTDRSWSSTLSPGTANLLLVNFDSSFGQFQSNDFDGDTRCVK